MTTGRLAALSRDVDPFLRSDKSEEFLDFFEDLLGGLVDRPIHLLEIGVLRGGAALLFATYFPNARILGVDLEPPPEEFFDALDRAGLTDRVKIALGSQADADFLQHSVETHFADGRLDVVIDDGSHLYDLTKATFDALFVPRVRPGGIYVIEDWGCGYWPRWPDGHRDGLHGLPRLVKELIDLVALPDRTREWEGERSIGSDAQLPSPISRAILTNGLAAFVRSHSPAAP